jgi:alkanesulfonate monooxygenase SsuD/methylene tetrahydromethanopterin reductase-like flavin-dependent oxidoreductase (luciferase family)
MTTWNRWPQSTRQMGVGIMLPIAERSAFGRNVRFADMVEMAQTAEEAGFDAIWLADHFLFRPPVAPEGEEYGLWEAWTCAAGLAQATSRINIGLLVTCLGWRNPGIVARMTDTIDEISGGRFILGVGAGWHEPEYTAYGMPFDHRVGRFEDSITILDGLLRTGRADHDGKFFSAVDAISQPRGPMGAKGGSPILVGSTGPRMLGLIAKYADAWNTVWHKEASATLEDLAALDAALKAEGRDPNSIARTAGGNIALTGYTSTRGNAMEGDSEVIARHLTSFQDLGFRHFVGGIDPCTPEAIREFGEALALFHAIGVPA